jgi:prepilin-type N-terminal cleavage/methylation domain-containing protein
MHVILSAAKDLLRRSGEILRSAQNDRRCAQNDGRSGRHAGFSLLEMIIVVVVIGVLVTIAAPSYQKAVDQSRVDIAAANLRAIWAAERLFWLENHTYTADLSQLQSLGLIDRAVPIANPGSTPAPGKYWETWYWFQVTLGSDPTASFTATANAAGYAQSAGWTSTVTIDETGTLTGTVSSPRVSITPGFQ